MIHGGMPFQDKAVIESSTSHQMGKQLKKVRKLKKTLTLEYINDTYRIHPSTLSRAENSEVLPESKIHMMLKVFIAEGIICTREWLMRGEGNPPHLSKTPEVVSEDMQDMIQDNLFSCSIIADYQKIPNSLVTMVHSNILSPMLYKGDYVGGKKIEDIEKNIDKINGYLCIIREKRPIDMRKKKGEMGEGYRYLKLPTDNSMGIREIIRRVQVDLDKRQCILLTYGEHPIKTLEFTSIETIAPINIILYNH